MGLDTNDIDDEAIVSERELSSSGSSSYRSDPVTNVSGGTVTMNPLNGIPVEGFDDPIQAGDVFVLTGASVGNGTYTIDTVTGPFTFTVAEPIPDSTGGTGEFRFKPGARMVGVDPTNLGNSGESNLQGVLEDLDSAITGGGLTPTTHRDLDQLVHRLAEDGFTEITYDGFNRPTFNITWTDPGKTVKIREQQLTYTGGLLTQVVWIQYDGVGAEVERVTKTITWAFIPLRIASVTTVKLP